MNQRQASGIIGALFLLLAVILLIVAGTLDAQDEAREYQHYCEMVDAGAWPAYRKGVECDEN